MAGTFVICSGATFNSDTRSGDNGYGDGNQTGLSITVLSGASVNGTDDGFYIADNNTITNYGTIGSTFGRGIDAFGALWVMNYGIINQGITADDITLNNASGATVSGSTAVYANNIATVTNAGTITGTGGFGAIYGASGVTVTNNASGTISASFASARAIYTFGDATVTNFGTISVTGAGSTAIEAATQNVTVTNSGTISASGTGSIAISAGADANITNNAGGTISASGNTSTAISADTLTLNNSGTVSASGSNSAALDVGTSGTITNRGTISATGSNSTAIFLDSGTLTNYGIISATGTNSVAIDVGTYGGTGADVRNYGTISSNGSSAFLFESDGHSLTNFGLIQATNGAYSIESCNCTTGNTVTNRGTIDGQIFMDGTGHTFDNFGLLTITDPNTPVGAQHTIVGTFTNETSGTLALRVTSDNTVFDSLAADDAVLAGTLKAVVQPGLYGSTTVYASVVATLCGCIGNFDQAVSSSPFFSASSAINGTNIDLTLTRLAFNAVPGMTDNQRAVGNALEPLYSTSLTGNVATFFSNLLAATSLDALSGEGLAATQNAAFNANQLFSATLLTQINAWLAGNPAGGSFAYAQADAKPIPAAFKALDQDQRIGGWRVWMSGFFGQAWNRGELPAGSADVRTTTGGGALGVDRQVAPDLLVGFAVGASASKFNVPDRATEGDVIGGHLAVYGAKTWARSMPPAAQAMRASPTRPSVRSRVSARPSSRTRNSPAICSAAAPRSAIARARVNTTSPPLSPWSHRICGSRASPKRA